MITYKELQYGKIYFCLSCSKEPFLFLKLVKIYESMPIFNCKVLNHDGIHVFAFLKKDLFDENKTI